MSQLPPTARSRGLFSCHSCRLLCRPAAGLGARQYCPRCGTTLQGRIPNSLGRCWALVLAAAILYLPANLLPITQATTLGKVQFDTILSGVIYFLKTGSWPIALVIFVASVLVPLIKLLILIFLLVTVQLRLRWRPRDRARLFRLVDLVGRWSMLDIYVVTVVVALVQLGALASIEAEIGAVYFAAVVVLTLLAAASFDPRLIWDVMEESDG